jgi:hypothetical protein
MGMRMKNKNLGENSILNIFFSSCNLEVLSSNIVLDTTHLNDAFFVIFFSPLSQMLE